MDQTGVVADGRVLHEVRSSARRVMGQADHVRIDDDAVVALAAVLARELKDTPDPEAGPDPWTVDPATGTAEERARLVLSLAAINFGSGYHPHLVKAPGCSGATTMAAALRRWAAAEPLTAARLATVTAAKAHRRFGQPPDGPGPATTAAPGESRRRRGQPSPAGSAPRAELMGLMAGALVELGTYVGDAHGGSFLGLVESAGNRAAGLVAVLARLPCFRDVASHRGRPVPFYKRAQLAAADLDRAFTGRAPAAFTDLDDLTAFADNLVPHVLRLEGVLRYDDDLVARIDAGELLAAGSAEEVEIRAGGVDAVERLRAALADRGVAVRSSELDARLWRRGGAPRFKAVPRHRTRSVFY